MDNSRVDYESLINPSKENIDFDVNVNTKSERFIFPKDIFEFIESDEFVGANPFPRQRQILEDYYGTRDDKNMRLYQELILISGMRSGKTKLASWIGTYENLRLLEVLEGGGNLSEYFKKEAGVMITRGQRLYTIVVASALDQSEATVFAQIKEILDTAPWFMRYIAYLREKKQYSADKYEIRLKNQLYIKAEDSNSASQVGKTIHTLLFDEICRLDVADGEIAKRSQKKSAQSIYSGLAKGTTTLGKRKNIIVVSSPIFEDDYGMQLLMRSGKMVVSDETRDIVETLSTKYPGKVTTRLGYHSTTFDFNPSIDRATDQLAQSTLISSPLTFNRDYLALPPSGVDAYFEDADKIDAAVSQKPKIFVEEMNYHFDEQVIDGLGATVVHPYVGKKIINAEANPLVKYVVCCDPAARNDSFALGIGHGEWIQVVDNSGEPVKKLKTVIDYVTRWVPNKEKKIQVSFENVIEFLRDLRRRVNIDILTFDQWNSDSFIQTMRSMGINPKQLPITLTMWEILKLKVGRGLVEFPSIDSCKDTEHLLMELKKLQLIKGKEVNHPPNFTKDLADVVARINWVIEESSSHIYGGMDARSEEMFVNSMGGSESFKKVLKMVYPIHEQSNLNSQSTSNKDIFLRGFSS